MSGISGIFNFFVPKNQESEKKDSTITTTPVETDQSNSDDIRHKIVNVSGFDTLEITLSNSGNIYTRAECQMNLENTLELYANVGGEGVVKGVFRSFSTGTFFLNNVRVKEGGTTGKVTIFSIVPGNIQAIHIQPEDTWCIHHSAFLACSTNISIETGISFHQTVTGNGTFYSRATNNSKFPGIIWLVSYGGVIKRDLKTEGSNFRLHSGLFLATKTDVYEKMSIEFASTIFSSIAGGQGIMMNFSQYGMKGGTNKGETVQSGPDNSEQAMNDDGVLYYQTGNIDEFLFLISDVVSNAIEVQSQTNAFLDNFTNGDNFSNGGTRRKTRRLKKRNRRTAKV